MVSCSGEVTTKQANTKKKVESFVLSRHKFADDLYQCELYYACYLVCAVLAPGQLLPYTRRLVLIIYQNNCHNFLLLNVTKSSKKAVADPTSMPAVNNSYKVWFVLILWTICHT